MATTAIPNNMATAGLSQAVKPTALSLNPFMYTTQFGRARAVSHDVRATVAKPVQIERCIICGGPHKTEVGLFEKGIYSLLNGLDKMIQSFQKLFKPKSKAPQAVPATARSYFQPAMLQQPAFNVSI